MATRNIPAVIALKLQAAGHGTVGTDIFRGPYRPFLRVSGADVIPRAAIFVNSLTEGPPPVPMAGSSFQDVRRASVQVLIRASSYSATTPGAVYNTLADDLAGFVAVEVVGSGPAYVPGIDGNEDHLWTINLVVTYDQRLTGGYGAVVYNLDVYAA